MQRYQFMFSAFRLTLAMLGVFATWSAPVVAAPSYSVSFNDPDGAYSSYYPEITTGVLAAGAAWNRYITGVPGSSLKLEREFVPSVATTDGASTSTTYLRTVNGINIFEQGAATTLITGVSPNGLGPNGVIQIGTNYLKNDIWFDPDPYARTTVVPANKIDAQSDLLHEIGHILGFSGLFNPVTGQSPAGNYETTYDQYVSHASGDIFFTGPNAEAVYGGPVPLTSGNYRHVGNRAPRPGEDLLPDLMNGVEFFNGRRYYISQLDAAILADTGVPVNSEFAIPEPSSILVLSFGSAVMLLAGRCFTWYQVSRSSSRGRHSRWNPWRGRRHG